MLLKECNHLTGFKDPPENQALNLKPTKTMAFQQVLPPKGPPLPRKNRRREFLISKFTKRKIQMETKVVFRATRVETIEMSPFLGHQDAIADLLWLYKKVLYKESLLEIATLQAKKSRKKTNLQLE